MVGNWMETVTLVFYCLLCEATENSESEQTQKKKKKKISKKNQIIMLN